MHRLSNPTSECCGRIIHKVISYLTCVFGEDRYLNFDSLDYNVVYCGNLFSFLMTKTLFPFLQTKVAVEKKLRFFISFIYLVYIFIATKNLRRRTFRYTEEIAMFSYRIFVT